MPLHLDESISAFTNSFSSMADGQGFPLIIGATNLREFVNSTDWTNSHGPALIASALFFKKQWSEFYIPSSYTGTTYPKWGTHPRLDGLLSTRSLRFIHHGDQLDRLHKLESILKSPLAPLSYDRLRVCWNQEIGLRNCGTCEKCIRTITALEVLGQLHHISTFARPFSTELFSTLSLRTHQSRLFATELIAEAGIHNRSDIARALTKALKRHRSVYLWKRIKKQMKKPWQIFAAKCRKLRH